VVTETDDDFGDEVEEGDEAETDEDKNFDKARALSTIQAQRKSEKALKATLKTMKDELEAIKTKDLPDADRAKKALADAEERAAKAEQALQKSSLRTTALEEAVKLGFKSPALAFRLLDVDDVEWDGEQPSNVKELLRAVLKSDPYLKGGRRRDEDQDEEDGDDEGADAGQGRSRKSKAGGFSMNNAIRAAAGR
jgi:small-conductance mechanosensitive channel